VPIPRALCRIEPRDPVRRRIYAGRAVARRPGKAARMSSSQSSGRTSRGFALILRAARAAGLTGRRSPRIPYAGNDEPVFVTLDDPAMAAAIDKARRTLPWFLDLAKHPARKMDEFALRIIIAAGTAQLIWIYPFAHVGERFIGQVSNMPLWVPNLAIGFTIAFDRTEIVDWMFREAGLINGNFTARATLSAGRPRDREKFKGQFGLDFDF